MVAVNSLVRTKALQKALWQHDGRSRRARYGERRVCECSVYESRRRQWVTIRGISDFGTRASKKESHRPAAAYAAAALAEAFLREGLLESDPVTLRQPEPRALNWINATSTTSQHSLPSLTTSFANDFVSL